MGDGRVVIVGAGQGGFQAAASLRQEKFAGPVTLIGEEPGLPYQRPPLSKAYLKDGDAARLALRSEKFYVDNDIDYRPELRIAAIDRDAGEVVAENGARFDYDHLILATGSRNRIPPIENLDLDGVLGIRTLTDAEALRGRMPGIRHAIVVGGGFIGLEFAAVARSAGVKVTVVEGLDRLMARAVSPAMSAYFAKAHRDWGAELLFGRFVAALLDDGAGKVSGLRLSDGTEISGDMVVIAAGVQPNDELAAAAGLATENGVMVDDHLCTEDPAISALGDCCSFPEPIRAQRVRLESVQAATDHARCIAKRIAGAPAPYAAAPWFWSDQSDRKLQIVGLGGDADEYEIHEGDHGRMIVYAFAAKKLIAVETVNAAGEHMAGRRLIGGAQPVMKADLEGAGYDIRALMKSMS